MGKLCYVAAEVCMLALFKASKAIELVIAELDAYLWRVEHGKQ